jgi:hypothetical protein
VAFKFGNDLALTRKMPFAIADMAFGVREVIAKPCPPHTITTRLAKATESSR